MKRIESLDYLRGIMAFAVMLYHYLSWTFGKFGSESTLGRLGIYAVATFYVLSGLSLAIAYKSKFNGFHDFQAYVIKRVFRIYPLFWLAVTLSVLLGLAQNILTGGGGDPIPSPYKLFLNYTLLFGFIKPDAYLTTGAWSIGNEMVFYLFFPFFVLAGRKGKYVVLYLVTICMLPCAYFAFLALDPRVPLGDQWHLYINPFNQIFLFASGVAIGFLAKPCKQKSLRYVCLLATCALLFVFLPASGDRVAIVTGYRRLAFSGLCVAVCLFVYLADIELKSVARKYLKFLGDASYSIYLLHPIVCVPILWVTNKLGWPKLSGYVLLSIPMTLLVSYLSYTRLEKPMMRLGATVASKLRPAGACQAAA